MRYRVEMTCKEISRATVVIDTGSEHASEDDLEDVKDKGWARFDMESAKKTLEQENYTKVTEVTG